MCLDKRASITTCNSINKMLTRQEIEQVYKFSSLPLRITGEVRTMAVYGAEGRYKRQTELSAR
jgi:hypothetical protein